MVDLERGKPSLTHWELLEPQELEDSQGQDCSRVHLRPVTGRSHQLRVHLAAIGHPILGDDLYADEDTCARSSRLLLHATALAVPHPDTGQTMNFRSAAPF